MERPIAYLRYGIAGHAQEYLLTVQPGPFIEASSLPESWERLIQQSLGTNWIVRDRGRRIEIIPPQSHWNEADDLILRAVIQQLIAPTHEINFKNMSLSKE